MKNLITIALVVFAASALAQDCCDNKKAGSKTYAQASSCGKSGKAASKCGGPSMSAEEEFMHEAERMTLQSEGKESCCKSTPAKMVAKGEKGCCNEPGKAAKFKVFVAGEGYQFFGCAGSAAEGRKTLLAKGVRVGAVQAVKLSTSTIR